MKRYKLYTWNDTGKQTWRDEYDIAVDTDDEAMDIATTWWLENSVKRSAVAGELCEISGISLKKFGKSKENENDRNMERTIC